MWFLRPDTFDNQPFRKGKQEMYSIADMDCFDADFCKQLHFNFSAIQNTQKQRESLEATRARRLSEINLDALPDDSTSTSKQHELSRYVLKDILDCPACSRFIVCLAADEGKHERGAYYSEKARIIASDDLKRVGLPVESWRMSTKKYIIVQGKFKRSLDYSDIKMKSMSTRQFRDVFSNKSGGIAIQFEGIFTRLNIPWRDFINASRSIMLFGDPFTNSWSFLKLFRKMQPQHAHHILHQFACEYFGNSRACLMLFIK
jgi:hypothetical protein